MLLYVPAHTTAVGFHKRQAQATWRQTSRGNLVSSGSYLIDIAFSQKSDTVTGQFSSTFPTFRKATNYSRLVATFEDLNGGYDVHLKDSRGGEATGTSGSHSNIPGVLQASVPSLSFSTGGVSVSSNMVNRAVTEARVKLAAMHVNLGATLAEAKRTASGVATRVKSLVKALIALKRGNFSYAYYSIFGRRRGVQRSKTASELWLEWQYGWKPLIDDIYGGIEQVNQGFREKNLLFSVERTLSQPLDPRSVFLATVPMSRVETTGQATETVKVVLWGAVTSGIHAPSALGLINPASIAWELVPWSFVLDWLVPVGTWLESLSASVGISYVDGHRVSAVYGDVTGNRIALLAEKDPSKYYGKAAKLRVKFVGMRRTVYGAFPWALPYYKSPFSSTHLASAAALLRTARR